MMELTKSKKLLEAKIHLEQALSQYKDKKNDLNFLTVTKAFEIMIEYAWREMKRIVEDQGLEAPSPKMAIKEAARLKIIKNPEKWIEAINARNSSVHDYFGISEKEFVELAFEVLELIKK